MPRQWAALFNDFLQRRQASHDEDHSPFTDDDYRHFVDGKARGDGVTDFLGLARNLAPTEVPY